METVRVSISQRKRLLIKLLGFETALTGPHQNTWKPLVGILHLSSAFAIWPSCPVIWGGSCASPSSAYSDLCWIWVYGVLLGLSSKSAFSQVTFLDHLQSQWFDITNNLSKLASNNQLHWQPALLGGALLLRVYKSGSSYQRPMMSLTSHCRNQSLVRWDARCVLGHNIFSPRLFRKVKRLSLEYSKSLLIVTVKQNKQSKSMILYTPLCMAG